MNKAVAAERRLHKLHGDQAQADLDKPSNLKDLSKRQRKIRAALR